MVKFLLESILNRNVKIKHYRYIELYRIRTGKGITIKDAVADIEDDNNE